MDLVTKGVADDLRAFLGEMEAGKVHILEFTHVHPPITSPVIEYRIRFVRPDPRVVAGRSVVESGA